MNIKLLLLSFLLILSSALLAQRKYLPGYIIKGPNDTVRGWIDYRNWEYNPSRINFRTSPEAVEKIFSLTDIEEFGIDGKDKYRKAAVTMDMNPVNLTDLQRKTRDSTLNTVVFLRVLVDGSQFDLYEYVETKDHYFLQVQDGPISELSYKIHYDETTTSLITSNGFHEQILKALEKFSGNEEHRSKVTSLSYRRSDLVKFFRDVNGPTEMFVPQDQLDTKAIAQFFVGGGALFGQMGFQGDDDILNSLTFKSVTEPIITAGIDLFTSRSNQAFFLRGEISASSYKGDGKGTSVLDNVPGDKANHTYELSQFNIVPAVSVNYCFVRSEKTFVYAGAGTDFHFSTYSRNSLTTVNQRTGEVKKTNNYPEVKESWANVNLRLGVIISKKVEVAVSFMIAGTFVEYVDITETSKPATFRVFYRFGSGGK